MPAVLQDPYGEETETEEGDEEGRGATDVTIVSDAKRLVVCKKTGETTLHKAARLGYEVPTTYGLWARALCVVTQLRERPILCPRKPGFERRVTVSNLQDNFTQSMLLQFTYSYIIEYLVIHIGANSCMNIFAHSLQRD